MKRRESIDGVIDRSSLGTPAAKKVRARTPKATRTAILKRAARRSQGEEKT